MKKLFLVIPIHFFVSFLLGCSSEVVQPAKTELPQVFPTITDIPSPNIILDEPRIIEIATDFITEEAEVESYHFSEYVRTVDILPDGRIMGFTFDEKLVIVELNENDVTLTPLVDNVSPIFFAPAESNHIFVAAMPEFGQPFPIWGIDKNENEPIYIGHASGLWPLFSVTSDGKVVLIEDGYLMQKWVSDNEVHSRRLIEVENRLGLNWDEFDFTQMPYHGETPFVEFVVSPDGHWLAIFDGGREKFWLITVDGEIVQEVPFPGAIRAPGEGSSVRFYEWSPDSQWIGYSIEVWIDSSDPVNIEFSDLQIVSVNDSSNPISLVDSSTVIGTEVTWSPDGEFLAFSTVELRGQLHPSGFSVEYLFLAERDGKNIRQLSRLLAGDSVKSIYWADDGQTLIFKCQSPDSGQQGELCEINTQQ